MSQSNTETNNSHNRNSGRGGRGQGPPPPNGSGRGDRRTDRGNKSIAKYSFKGKMKDGLISELTITETGNRPSQFKKIYDALPVFCADKNYGGLDEVLRTGRDKVKDDFMPAYPNANLWSNTHQIQVATVAAGVALIEGSTTGQHVTTYQLVDQTIVTNANLQKQLLSEYERNLKNKSQEYSKFLTDKKSLITILFGQCDEATQTEIAL